MALYFEKYKQGIQTKNPGFSVGVFNYNKFGFGAYISKEKSSSAAAFATSGVSLNS